MLEHTNAAVKVITAYQAGENVTYKDLEGLFDSSELQCDTIEELLKILVVDLAKGYIATGAGKDVDSLFTAIRFNATGAFQVACYIIANELHSESKAYANAIAKDMLVHIMSNEGLGTYQDEYNLLLNIVNTESPALTTDGDIRISADHWAKRGIALGFLKGFEEHSQELSACILNSHDFVVDFSIQSDFHYNTIQIEKLFFIDLLSNYYVTAETAERKEQIANIKSIFPQGALM